MYVGSVRPIGEGNVLVVKRRVWEWVYLNSPSSTADFQCVLGQGHFTSLCLSCLICKGGMIYLSSSVGCCVALLCFEILRRKQNYLTMQLNLIIMYEAERLPVV